MSLHRTSRRVISDSESDSDHSNKTKPALAAQTPVSKAVAASNKQYKRNLNPFHGQCLFDELSEQMGAVKLGSSQPSSSSADKRTIGVVDAVKARAADYGRGMGVPLGVMKDVPFSVIGTAAHDLRLQQSQKKSSAPLRQAPGKEKTGMLVRAPVARKLEREAAAAAAVASRKSTEIAVPGKERPGFRHFHREIYKRYQVFCPPSVLVDDDVKRPLGTISAPRVRRGTKGADSSDASDASSASQGLLELMDGLQSLSIAETLHVDTPAEMTVDLKPHQRGGVAWMLRNERNADVRGGIIGDDMGMGKTVQALALVMANPPDAGRPHTTLIVSPLATIDHWKREAETRVRPGLLRVHLYHGPKKERDPEALAQYDLIITTYATLLSDWRSLDGPGSMSYSFKKRQSRDQEVLASGGPLFCLKWRRVILDEAHEIKSPVSKKSKACHDLVADYRWCMSGTPIQNCLEDVYSLLRFLRFYPYCVMSTFNKLFVDEAAGKKEMRSVLSKLMLRRDKQTMVDNKPILDLPPRSFYFHSIDLSIAERIYYDCLNELAEAQASSAAGRMSFLVLLVILLRLRQTTSHLQVSPIAFGNEDDPDRLDEGLVEGGGLPSYLEADMSFSLSVRQFWMPTSDSVRNIPIASGQGETHEHCAQCSKPFDHLKGRWVHRCGAFVCRQCVLHGINAKHCRMCKKQRPGGYKLDINSIANALPGSELPENGRVFAKCVAGNATPRLTGDVVDELQQIYSSNRPSAKMKAILDILLAMRRSNATDKCVIFCEHLRALDLISAYIAQAGFTSIIYQGSMTKPKRDEALSEFASKDISVLLVSKKAGGVGINLTAANHIIIESLWWNPAIDSQAIDRIYRIGQNKPVHVHILIARETVDERMFDIQEKKRHLIDAVIGTVPDDKSKRLNVVDVMHILRLFPRGQQQ